MQSPTSKFLTESETSMDPSFSQQALRDLEKIIEQSIDDSIQQPTERTEDHSYAQLSTAATCVKTSGKSASILIKRLRIEKNVNITTSRGETPLIIASQLGVARFASLIMMRGADLNAQDVRGYAALTHTLTGLCLMLVRVHVYIASAR
jgi:hypothetical protein